MSRIGMQPISIPDGVEVKIDGVRVRVKGPKGELEQGFRPEIAIKEDDGTLRVTRESDEPQVRALHGLTRALLNNMVVGTSEGFEKDLEVHGVGYRAELEGSTLVLSVGFFSQSRSASARRDSIRCRYSSGDHQSIRY